MNNTYEILKKVEVTDDDHDDSINQIDEDDVGNLSQYTYD